MVLIIQLIMKFSLAFGLCMIIGGVWIMVIKFIAWLGFSNGAIWLDKKVSLMWILISVIILLLIIENIDTLYCMAGEDKDKPIIVDNEMTMNIGNLQIQGLDYVARNLGEAGAYAAAVSAATKILKTATLTPTTKIIAAVAAGGGSLISYKIIQLTARALEGKPQIIIEVDKNSSTISKEDKEIFSKANDGSSDTPNINCSLEKAEASDFIELLQLNLELQIIISYLLFVLLILYTAKLAGESNICDKFITHPLLHNLVNKLISAWSKTNNVWIIIGILTVLVFSIVNIVSIVAVLKILS